MVILAPPRPAPPPPSRPIPVEPPHGPPSPEQPDTIVGLLPPEPPPVRLSVLLAFIMVCGALLAWRLFYWQVLEHTALQTRATNEHVREQILPARLGVIRDTHGQLLAASVAADYVSGAPSRIDDPARVAARLAPLLGIPAAVLQAKLADRSRDYVRLTGKVDERVRQRIAPLGLPGISLERTARRVYPEGTLAAHVLGFADGEGEAWYGLEGFYKEMIGGRPGRIRAEMDTAGTEIGFGFREQAAPTDGHDLVLTIDRTTQHFVERELVQALQQHDAPSGTAIVMDVRTGAILAMASHPSFDPNQYERYGTEFFRNPAIAEAYEPGSTFKLITAAAAIDLGLVNPASTYEDMGEVMVGPFRISNWDGKAHGRTTVTQLLAKSLNVGAVWLSQLLGAARFYDYVAAFGFGQPTGIDLQGEQAGNVRAPGEPGWTPSDLATNSFGQGLSVTPIQLVAAVGALANEGKLMRPYVVRQIVDPDSGQVVRTTEPTVVRQAVSPATARLMLQMMVHAAENGTTNYALVPGYKVGGKTGTASIPTANGYDPDLTIASFVGIAPADNPRFAILVKIDRPRDSRWGSVVAAPLFRTLVEELMIRYRIKPTQPRVAPAPMPAPHSIPAQLAPPARRGGRE